MRWPKGYILASMCDRRPRVFRIADSVAGRRKLEIPPLIEMLILGALVEAGDAGNLL